MKKKLWKVATAVLCCLTSVGCSTSVIDDELNQPGNDVNGKDLTLSFKIMQNNYTRSEKEDDAKISTLTLAFYKITNTGTTYLYSAQATSDSNPYVFSVDLDSDKEIPNAVVALANLPSDFSEDALSDEMAIDYLQSDGGLIMSNARYYNTESETKDCIKYTTITPNNLFNNEPVQIYLDRVAAKVNVNVASDATLATLVGYNTENAIHEFNLSLLSWDVIGTDKSSYLMKNCGLSYSDISLGEIGNGSSSWQWNNPANHSLSWAHSVNWSNTSFPAPGEESETSITNHMKFSDIRNEYGKSALYHETTRKSSLFKTPNAIPSVVLIGQYTLKGSIKPQTLYRRGNLILTQDELYSFIADVNTKELLLYYIGDNNKPCLRASKTSIEEAFSNEVLILIPNSTAGDKTMPNIVSFQINPEKINNYRLISNAYATPAYISEERMEEINAILLEKVGTWEIYEDGKCFFHFPIEHLGKQFDTAGNKTGSYGIVRNHCYNITVKNISGIGQGVKSDAFAGAWPTQEFSTGVNYNVTVNKWTNVNQEIK